MSVGQRISAESCDATRQKTNNENLENVGNSNMFVSEQQEKRTYPSDSSSEVKTCFYGIFINYD